MTNRLLAFMIAGALLAPAAQAGPDRYTLDKDHTHVIFFADHVGFSQTIGRFNAFDGYFTFDEKEPEKGAVEITFKAASIDTGVAQLDKALLGEKFLNAETFPLIRFKSNHVEVTGKNTADIAGELTLLGVSKPLTVHVTHNKSGIHPFTNNYVAGFSADASFRRSDFGMKAYIPDVGDDIKVHIEMEGTNPLKHPGNSKTPH